jgi:hypothetical protein
MDLLTRGAGFGYIGSTITSLIYASFTFIFFALEAAIMAYALELAFGLPPAWGYLVCAVVVIPLVTYGVTAISRLQAWTQPLWLLLLILPYAFVLTQEPGSASPVSGNTAACMAATAAHFRPASVRCCAHRRHRARSRRWASKSTTCASCRKKRPKNAGRWWARRHPRRPRLGAAGHSQDARWRAACVAGAA